MPDYRLLAIDIDGTLVNSEDHLTDATRKALADAQAAGIHVVLATGRRYRRALPLVEALELNLPLVTASGALIKEPAQHETLFVASFEEGLLLDLLCEVDQAGYEPVLYSDTYAEGFDFYCRRIDTPQMELAEYFALNPGSHRLHEEIITRPPPGVFAGFAMGSLPQMQKLQGQLQERFGPKLELHVLRSPRYQGYMCELLPGGVSKWTAIAHLAQEWNVPREQICAVGDDVNDVPMITAAGLGVAMENAVPEVKAVADRIAPTQQQDGVAEVVRWLLDA